MAWPWTADELETVRINYADFPTFLIAYLVGRSEQAVYSLARTLGLHKSEAYLAGPWACRLRRDNTAGVPYRFRKGQAPANKGLRRPGWASGRMRETQFKKGQKPHTWLPIGSTRINGDGYRDRKVSDTGYPPRDWKGEHILLWEEHLGPVPPGHCICFKNGDKADIRIDNLACISHAERMRRNTIHRYPPELKDAIRAHAKLQRTIRKRYEEQAPGSPRPSLRNDRRAARRREAAGHRARQRRC